MANFTGVLIKPDYFVVAGENATGVISGTITKSSNPIQRRIHLYQEPNTALIDASISDSVDGSYSFPISFFGDTTRYTVICKGESYFNENDTIFTSVIAKAD